MFGHFFITIWLVFSNVSRTFTIVIILYFPSFIFQRNELSQELAHLLWNSFGTIAVLLQV